MQRDFIGRGHFLEELETRYHDSKSDLVLIYGRRRVGKSRLIHEFIKNKKWTFFFTGVEVSKGEKENLQNYKKIQITNFLHTLSDITRKKEYKQLSCDSWEECFTQLNKNLPDEDIPCCLILDEFPWMAGSRLELVRVLFKFWELKWSQRKKLMLIICGSSVGFLDKHFINSTQFYGRSTLLIHLSPLTIFEAKNFFSTSRSPEEMLEFYMIFGGIPRYLEQISKRDSVRQTINRLCFTPDSFFVDELPHLLRSSFMRESDKYQKILRALTIYESLGYNEISQKIKSAKGGSFKHLLENLMHSDMIEKFTPLDRLGKTNLFKFRLSDEFIRFYYLFIEPNMNLIQKNTKGKDIYDIIIPQKKYFSWKGRIFERIIQKHALDIADRMGISLVVKNYGSYFIRDKNSPQLDLVYFRTDGTLTVCEVKYSERPILLTPALKNQIQRQKEFLQKKFYKKRIEHYLITNGPVGDSLKRGDLFHRIIDFFDL